MARTLGAKNKPKPELRQDNYLETFTASNLRPSPAAVGYAPYAMLTEQEATGYYLGNGFARRIVDIPPQEMVRAGFTIEGIDNKLLKSIMSRAEELDLLRIFNDAMRWSRLHGGSVLIYGVDDGGTLEEEMNPKGGKLEFLRVYDRHKAKIWRRYTDPQSPLYGMPELWQITPNGISTAVNTSTSNGTAQAVAGSYYVHASRVHVFDGDSIPDDARNNNNGWGSSALQACIDEMKRLCRSHGWAEKLLERSQQAVHGIPNLSGTLAQRGGPENMQKRIIAVDMARNILNTIVVDSLETYEVQTASLAGLPDVLDRFAEALSAVTGIPIYLLMGRSPGGLNATGKSNENAWHALVASMQADILHKPLDRAVTYIRQGLEGGGDGGEYELKFNPLAVPSDTEQAEIDSKKAAAKKARMEETTGYIAAGVLSTKEVREELKKEDFPDLNLELEIKPPSIEELEIGAEIAATAAGNEKPPEGGAAQ